MTYSGESRSRDVRVAQTMACHVIVDIYARYELPPLFWSIEDRHLTDTDAPRLEGQVPEFAGDEEYRRGVLADYADVLSVTPHTSRARFDEGGARQYLRGFGTYEGVTVLVYTRVETERGAS